jgi:hypothetical protein
VSKLLRAEQVAEPAGPQVQLGYPECEDVRLGLARAQLLPNCQTLLAGMPYAADA